MKKLFEVPSLIQGKIFAAMFLLIIFSFFFIGGCDQTSAQSQGKYVSELPGRTQRSTCKEGQDFVGFGCMKSKIEAYNYSIKNNVWLGGLMERASGKQNAGSQFSGLRTRCFTVENSYTETGKARKGGGVGKVNMHLLCGNKSGRLSEYRFNIDTNVFNEYVSFGNDNLRVLAVTKNYVIVQKKWNKDCKPEWCPIYDVVVYDRIGRLKNQLKIASKPDDKIVNFGGIVKLGADGFVVRMDPIGTFSYYEGVGYSAYYSATSAFYYCPYVGGNCEELGFKLNNLISTIPGSNSEVITYNNMFCNIWSYRTDLKFLKKGTQLILDEGHVATYSGYNLFSEGVQGVNLTSCGSGRQTWDVTYELLSGENKRIKVGTSTAYGYLKYEYLSKNTIVSTPNGQPEWMGVDGPKKSYFQGVKEHGKSDTNLI